MALRKTKELQNGVQADYWKIFQCGVKSKIVRIGLFKSKEIAENLNNKIEHRTFTYKENPFTVEAMDIADQNPLKIAYEKIKESKKVEQQKKDAEGNLIFDKEKPVMETVETNWFVDAEDC